METGYTIELRIVNEETVIAFVTDNSVTPEMRRTLKTSSIKSCLLLVSTVIFNRESQKRSDAKPVNN